MRSREDDVPHGAAADRALEQAVCGIGGRLTPSPASLSDALTAADATYGERIARRLERFAAAARGSFVWTRDTYGWFWLGRLSGAWRYDSSAPAWVVDLVHVRSCEWIPDPIPDQEVPLSVQRAFARGGRNWQQIRATDAAPASARVWSRHRPDAPAHVIRVVG
ncbi:GAF domain-containing protein [Microbacterium alcoholitolerans]|uniref:GAF domain-containing protein n=1 Tax=unclassified Microbacterium TaxID=2609290 RepID=UPI003D16847A